MTLLPALLQDMFFAAIPAVGFALLFNVPVRALRYCAMLGALGHGLRFLLLLMTGLRIRGKHNSHGSK